MVPRGLCIYCGHARSADDPKERCPRCGHTAEGVRWWPGVPGRSRASGVAPGALFAAVAGLAASAVLRAQVEPVLSSLLVVAAVTALVSWPLVRALRGGREPGTWSFATDDGERIGTAVWDGAKLFWAFSVRVQGERIDAPDYAKVITAAAARTAGARSLGPGVCLALKIDEAEYEDQFPARSLAPMIAAALVGMAARDGCGLHWQRGWRFSRFEAASPVGYQRLILTSGAAPAEEGWLEREVLALIAKAEQESAAAWRPPSDEPTDAHYRALAQNPPARFCSLDDLARALVQSTTFREDCAAKVPAEPERAGEAAMAFRAFAASHPEVLEHLLDSFCEE